MDTDQYRHLPQPIHATFSDFPSVPLYIPPQNQPQSFSLVKAATVTAAFSHMDPCQLQILIKRLCDSTGDNLCLSSREVKILWKEFLHGSTLKLSATPLGSQDGTKGMWAAMF